MAAARVRTNRFVLHWGWVQPTQGTYQLGAGGPVHRPACLPRNPDGPVRVGEPGLGPGLGLDAPDRRPDGRERVAEPPQGAGGALRARRQLLGQRVQTAIPGRRHPLPIQSWQIWNEPNLKKYFAPAPSPGKYARLVQISHDAIMTRDPKAQVVLAGLSGNGDMAAETFLNNFYAVSGIKNKFDVAALHPYAPTLDSQRLAIQRVRNGDDEPRRRRHAAVADRARLGIGASRPVRPQQGPRGSSADAHELLQDDPGTTATPGTSSDSSGTAGAILILPTSMRRAASAPARGCTGSTAPSPKPAYNTFRSFTAETTRPQATITGGPERHQRHNADLHLHLERARLDLRLQDRRKRLQAMQLAVYDPAAGQRQPCLLRQGDRCPGQRERSSSGGASTSTPSPRRRPRSPTPTPTRRPTTTAPRSRARRRPARS